MSVQRNSVSSVRRGESDRWQIVKTGGIVLFSLGASFVFGMLVVAPILNQRSENAQQAAVTTPAPAPQNPAPTVTQPAPRRQDQATGSSLSVEPDIRLTPDATKPAVQKPENPDQPAAAASETDTQTDSASSGAVTSDTPTISASTDNPDSAATERPRHRRSRRTHRQPRNTDSGSGETRSSNRSDGPVQQPESIDRQ